MIVMKFGGTSVESAAAIERVAGIVRERLDRHPVVVVSAMGKTTNKLLAIGDAAAQIDAAEARKLAAELREFHRREAAGFDSKDGLPLLEHLLEANFGYLDRQIEEIADEGEFSPERIDAVSSLGERLSSFIVMLAFRRLGIPATHVDSSTVVITDGRHTQATPIPSRTYPLLKETVPPLAREQVVVMGGFIGSTVEGVPTTLGRGGSDFSAALIGAGIDADEIQIWTDVDGILTADPRILPGGHRVRIISFAEAAELAYFGAKVLHPATVLPARENSIPVRVLNSRRPHVDGTLIIADPVRSANVVKSISCKRNITLVNIQSLRMLMAYGFLHRIFEVFARHRTPVDIVTTAEVSVSLTIEDTSRLDDIRADLEKIAEISIEEKLSIICLVGDNVRHTEGVAARTFRALENINVRMVSQGASQLNLSLVVADPDLPRAVEALHKEFFSELDPEVFATEAIQ